LLEVIGNREQSVRRLAQEHSAVSTAKPKLIQATDRRAQSLAPHQPDRHADIGCMSTFCGRHILRFRILCRFLEGFTRSNVRLAVR
jgi:hypothetical protein